MGITQTFLHVQEALCPLGHLPRAGLFMCLKQLTTLSVKKPDALFWFLKEMPWEDDNTLNKMKTSGELTLWP